MESFEIYAQQMQKMYADAFAAAEVMKKSAEDDRDAAARELDKAKDLREAAEKSGDRMALEYFAKKRKVLIEQTREETITALVLQHLKNERSEEDIMDWLDTDEETIKHCRIILKKQEQMEDNPRIEYSQTGRGGTLTYISGKTRINFDWEFAGGNSVAIIFIPEKKYWEVHTRTSLSERESILEFVAREVTDEQAPGCTYRISENSIDILYK